MNNQEVIDEANRIAIERRHTSKDRVIWGTPTGNKLHIERKDSTNVICGKITRSWKRVSWLSRIVGGTDNMIICRDCAYWYGMR